MIFSACCTKCLYLHIDGYDMDVCKEKVQNAMVFDSAFFFSVQYLELFMNVMALSTMISIFPSKFKQLSHLLVILNDLASFPDRVRCT